jgi:hypothetical protein
MVKVKVNDKEYYMDGYLKANLDVAKNKVKEDFDWVFLVDGRERSGKSVFALQMAYYCDSSFCLDRVCFTADEFKKAVLKAEPYTAVIYDEAFTGLSSKDTMSRTNKALVEMLMEIGQKNLFIFIVLPTFYALTTYVGLFRSCALLHVTMKSFERGYFSFYNYEQKILLFRTEHKLYGYKTRPFFYGRFTNYYPISEIEYRDKKRKSLTKKDSSKSEKDTENNLDWLFIWLQQFEDVQENVKMKILKMPETTFFRKKKQYMERLNSDMESEV